MYKLLANRIIISKTVLIVLTSKHLDETTVKFFAAEFFKAMELHSTKFNCYTMKEGVDIIDSMDLLKWIDANYCLKQSVTQIYLDTMTETPFINMIHTI